MRVGSHGRSRLTYITRLSNRLLSGFVLDLTFPFRIWNPKKSYSSFFMICTTELMTSRWRRDSWFHGVGMFESPNELIRPHSHTGSYKTKNTAELRWLILSFYTLSKFLVWTYCSSTRTKLNSTISIHILVPRGMCFHVEKSLPKFTTKKLLQITANH